MNQYQEAVKQQKLNKCPYLRKIPNGDEIYCHCDYIDHACQVEYQNEPCEEWEDIQKEWLAEIAEDNIKNEKPKLRIIKEVK